MGKKLSELYSHCKGSSNGEKYLVLHAPQRQNLRFKHLLKCTVCLTPVYTTPVHIFEGHSPCRCGKYYFRTPEKRLGYLLNKFTEMDWDFGEVNPDLSSAKSKFKVKCNVCGTTRTTTFDYITSGKDCAGCTGNYNRTEEQMIDALVEHCGRLGDVEFIKFKTTYTNSRSIAYFKCHKCDGIFEKSSGVFLGNPHGCSHCVRSGRHYYRPAKVYIMAITDPENKTVCYKFGVSEKLISRLSNIRRTSNKELFVEVYGAWDYKSSYYAYLQESQIKDKIPKSEKISKEDMPDGHTEIFDVEHLPLVESLIENSYQRLKTLDYEMEP